jgi:hypothetical protein
MSNRGDHILFKMMPNGNIRAFQGDTKDKRGVSELQFTDINNESPTVTSTTPPKIIEYEESSIH